MTIPSLCRVPPPCHPNSRSSLRPPQNPGGHGDGDQLSSCQSPVTAQCPLHFTARRHPRVQSPSGTSFQPMGAIYLPTKAEAPEDADTETMQLMKEDTAS